MSEGKPKALVVEDDPGVRAVVVEVLTGLGFDVVEAWDGFSATSAFNEDRLGASALTVVVLDNYFPAYRGAFARPKAVPFARRFHRFGLPVVVFSGDVSAEDKAELDRLGVEWVRKPYANELPAAIKRAMSQEAEA